VEKLHEDTEDLPQTMELFMDKARAFIKGKAACNNMVVATSRANGFSGTGTRNSFVNRRHQYNVKNKFQPYVRPAVTNMVRTTGSHPRFIQYTELAKTPRQILATEGVFFLYLLNNDQRLIKIRINSVNIIRTKVMIWMNVGC